MNISARTKISDLIKANPLSIDAIASLNPNLEKLRNPLLRKIFASRVTIKDAARISGADISHFFNVLEPLGFSIETDTSELKQSTVISEEPMKENITTASVILDVRPILASNKDPFNAIMSTLSQLKDGETMLLINSFEPTPLYKVLENKGFTHSCEKEENVFHVYIHKALKKQEEKRADQIESSDTFEFQRNYFGDKVTYIDVRHLEMPMPMATILKSLEVLEDGYALLVHHRKFPHFLIPELEERKFNIVYELNSEKEYMLLIYRKR